MILTHEQRTEKAIQHMILFAQYVASEYCQNDEQDAHVICAAAARLFSQKQRMDYGGKPAEWVGNEFSQYMRELVLDGSSVPKPTASP